MSNIINNQYEILFLYDNENNNPNGDIQMKTNLASIRKTVPL